MHEATKQAIIWTLIIVVGGGLLSLVLGQGFWGEKSKGGIIDGDTRIPPMSAACDITKPCKNCHPDK